MIEANFHPHSDYELGKLRGLGGRMVEVHCACPAEVAYARYNARPRHEVHMGALPLCRPSPDGGHGCRLGPCENFLYRF